MKISRKLFSLPIVALAAILYTPAVAVSQTTGKPANRITGPIDDAQRVSLAGTHTPHADPLRDVGAADPAILMEGMSIDLSRTPEQEADLQTLIAAQQDIHSPLYHQWLSPDEFGARFGASDGDIARIKAWLESNGFTVENVARGKNHIAFTGTTAMVERAFGAAIHQYTSHDGKLHIAPASDLTIPAALAPSIGFIRNLTSFRPHPHAKRALQPHTDHPNFTNGGNSFYLLTPGDLAVQYDINAAYNAGYTGAGQSIAVVGISYVLPSDISTFQKLAGVPNAKAPIYVLVPATGASKRSPGDEGESDIDVEYSSTVGKGAQVYLVYDGGSLVSDPFYAIQYAIDEKIAPIITNSYGDCELDETKAGITAFDAILAQGVAQGQTIISAAGDDGSVDCIEDYPDQTITTFALSVGLAVDYPASSVYGTAMGGTAFTPTEYTYPNTTYWNGSTNGQDTAVTLKQHVPEVVWNDDDPNYGTSAGGGGISLYEARPTWQAAGTLIGGTALPAGTLRLVPDISLFGSPNDPGLLICSSDPESLYPGQVGSCTNGFADAVTGDYTVFGGTSFDAPIFAGMLSILNQALNSTGQGNVNPTLYSLAANTTNYPLAFHDVTSGTNACTAGAAVCGTGTSTTNYSAGAGYDEASGLGSVDLMNLITAWPKPSAAALPATTTTVSPATAKAALSTSDMVTITVAGGTSTPSGTLTISVDGTVATSTLALVNGAGTYTFNSGLLGTHIINALYSGDATHAASSGIAQVSVGVSSPGFTLASTNATITSGSSGSATATVTPATGYTGIVNLALSAPASLTNACYVLNNVTVAGTTAVPASITIYTNSNLCPSGAVALNKKPVTLKASQAPAHSPRSPWERSSMAVAFAGVFLLLGASRRKSRMLAKAFLAMLTLMILSLGITGCTATPAPVPATDTTYFAKAGTYTLTLTGTDSSNLTLVSSTTFTLTIQ